MAAKLGPKIVNDGLVLCLDAADANSYAGEPTTNLLGSNDNPLNGMSNITFTKVETQSDGWIKYSMSGTFTGGTYPYICYIDTVSFTGGTAYTSRAMIKTNVESKFNYFGSTGINYVNQPLDAQGTGRSVVTEENGLNVYTVSREGFIYTSTTSQRGYLFTNPINNTTFNSSTDFVWIKNVQVEQKTYPTPYVYTSRSATNGWVDLSGNSNSGNLINGTNTGVSHYRDGQVIMPINNAYLEFDGSDDQVLISSLGSSYSNYSLEFWIAQTGASDSSRFYSWNAGGTFTVRYRTSPQNFQFHYNPLDGSPASTSVAGVTLSDTVNGIWHHVVITNNSAVGAIVYTDGVAGSTGEAAVAMGNYGHILGTGYAGIVPTKCKIASFKIYNKTLTAAEVLNNYNTTKGRFL